MKSVQPSASDGVSHGRPRTPRLLECRLERCEGASLSLPNSLPGTLGDYPAGPAPFGNASVFVSWLLLLLTTSRFAFSRVLVLSLPRCLHPLC